MKNIEYEKLLKEKIKYIVDNMIITDNNYNIAYHFYTASTFENNFSEEELEYLCNNLSILDEYINLKIPCQIVETTNGDLLVTDVGTFLLVDVFNYNILNEIDLLEIDINKIKRTKEITLNDFRKLIVRLNIHTYVDLKNRFFTLDKNVNLLCEIFDIYRYYEFLKNIDYKVLNKRFKTSDCNVIPCLPLEALNNEKRRTEVRKDNASRIEYIYDNFCQFENNNELSSYMDVVKNNGNVEKNIEKIKEALLNSLTFYYFETLFLYLKNNYSKYLDQEYLIELYKKQYDKLVKVDPKFAISLAKNLENKTPLIKLTSTSEEVHLSYKQFELYNDYPFGILKEQYKETYLTKDNTIEEYFICFNELFIKLYNMYYETYVNIVKNEDKNNLYDFIYVTIFNSNNFISIVRNSNFSVNEIKQLVYITRCYSKEAQEQFDEFYKKFCINERQKIVSFYNYLGPIKNDKEKVIEAINKFGMNIDSIYTEIINNKFAPLKVKKSIINILNNNLKDRLRVIDIMYLLDEMLDRELTLEEILEEKEIDKKLFDQLYAYSLKENPILYKYINRSLNQNKRRGYKKIIKLGYLILDSNINSLQEFNDKFPKYNFTKILNGLKHTELFNKLLMKSSLWKDYTYNSKLDDYEYENTNNRKK